MRIKLLNSITCRSSTPLQFHRSRLYSTLPACSVSVSPLALVRKGDGPLRFLSPLALVRKGDGVPAAQPWVAGVRVCSLSSCSPRPCTQGRGVGGEGLQRARLSTSNPPPSPSAITQPTPAPQQSHRPTNPPQRAPQFHPHSSFDGANDDIAPVEHAASVFKQFQARKAACSTERRARDEVVGRGSEVQAARFQSFLAPLALVL
jgi:hypothetical protein